MSDILVTCFLMPEEMEGLCVTYSVDLCNEFEFCPMIHIWKVCHICCSIFKFLQYNTPFVCLGLILIAAVSFLNTCLEGRALKKIEGCYLNMIVCLPVCHALNFTAISRCEPAVLFLRRIKSTTFSAARKLETSKPYTR